MNVLSLFDGISCGQVALERAGIQVDNYFASEIDKYAIQVTQKNYPQTIQIGDVREVKANNLPQIDLLLGGSPCQGFSFAGKQLNFNDPRSGLFFEYVRILKEVKPRYFLLENVKMKKEYQDVITGMVGVEPVMINSSLVSAQSRPRLYWTNIPGVEQPKDKGVYVKDILDTKGEFMFLDVNKTMKNGVFKKNYYQYDVYGKGNNSQTQRAYYLHGKHGCLDTLAVSCSKILTPDNLVRYTTRNEVERLQTLTDNYTSIVTESQAKKLLGNGWTVDVIVHILKNVNKGINANERIA